MENFFMALSDGTRLRILNLMREGEVCVTYFTDVLGCSQPKVSRHLAYLRKSGIVETKRDGKWIYYCIAVPRDQALTSILNELWRWMDTQESLRSDCERYKQIIGVTNNDDPLSETADTYANAYVKQIHERAAHNELEEFLL